MKTQLNWRKGFFKNTYEIYLENKKIGELKDKCWSQSAFGELNGKRYKFKTKGFLKQETQIIDIESNSIVGKITYNSWRTKAKIEYSGKEYDWKYNNTWNTKWSILYSQEIQVDYQGSSSKGKIEVNNQNELLILSGLFITNYYWQIMVAIMIAIFIPILTTISK